MREEEPATRYIDTEDCREPEKKKKKQIKLRYRDVSKGKERRKWVRRGNLKLRKKTGGRKNLHATRYIDTENN